MKTLLALATLPREGPSVRPRVLAYEPALAAAGIRLRFLPFLSSRGFSGFYSTRLTDRLRKAAHASFGYLTRVKDLVSRGRADCVLVHREVVPRGNPAAMRALKAAGLPIVYDLDDATWLPPRRYVEGSELSRRRMTRLKDPAEVDGMFRASDLVLAGNAEIARRARRLCTDVRIQPTVVDTKVFRPRPGAPHARPLVGWVGSPTATYCLKSIIPALARAARAVPFDLLVIGAGEEIVVPGVEVRNRPWQLEREAEDFASLSVGLYPLPDNAWTRGKCGMKAIQYLASEVPAVVSPVGVNREIVADGRTGFFAADEDGWADRLVTYLKDPGLRAEHGRAGRSAVRERWSLEAWEGEFVRAVLKVVG